jgi:hypothetical protein
MKKQTISRPLADQMKKARGLVALIMSQKATVTVFSDFRGGKSRANAFWRNSLIHNQASHVFLSSKCTESVLKTK